MQTHADEALNSGLLRILAEAKPPCITIAVQLGGNPRGRLQDALRTVETELKDLEVSAPPELLPSLRDLISHAAEAKPKHSLLIFASPDFQHQFTGDVPVQEVVSVDEEFYLRSALPLLAHHVEFYLLALSQRNTRLLHCTESESGEVALPAGTPMSFADSRQTRPPDHDLQNRSTAGPSAGGMSGVLSGSSSDVDNKDEYLHNFFRSVDRGINSLLRETKIPLVVVAVDHELALYRSLNTYPHLVEPGVHGSPDGLKGGEMHRRALELLQSQPPEATRTVLANFDKQAGTGHASSHAQEIVRAAYDGRVSHLFLQEAAEYRGAFDEVRRKVKRHDDGITPMRDLLNEAVVQTLRHGGEAHLLTAKEMPNGVPICAVFRYPAPELQAAMKENAAASEASTSQ